MSTTVLTKEERIHQLLQKIDGQPTGSKNNPIPTDYPGLSFEDAVELRMLLHNCDRKTSEQDISDVRDGTWVD